MNNEPLDIDTTVSLVTIEFQFVNLETVGCIVHDGCETDSVTWLIDVVDPRDVSYDTDDLLPESISLSTPFQNPFNSMLRVDYDLPEVADVMLSVYDLYGRSVVELVSGRAQAGFHTVAFNGTGLASGVYLLRYSAAGYASQMKVVLVK